MIGDFESVAGAGIEGPFPGSSPSWPIGFGCVFLASRGGSSSPRWRLTIWISCWVGSPLGSVRIGVALVPE